MKKTLKIKFFTIPHQIYYSVQINSEKIFAPVPALILPKTGLHSKTGISNFYPTKTGPLTFSNHLLFFTLKPKIR